MPPVDPRGPPLPPVCIFFCFFLFSPFPFASLFPFASPVPLSCDRCPGYGHLSRPVFHFVLLPFLSTFIFCYYSVLNGTFIPRCLLWSLCCFRLPSPFPFSFPFPLLSLLFLFLFLFSIGFRFLFAFTFPAALFDRCRVYGGLFRFLSLSLSCSLSFAPFL